jgi:hypothetical protein
MAKKPVRKPEPRHRNHDDVALWGELREGMHIKIPTPFHAAFPPPAAASPLAAPMITTLSWPSGARPERSQDYNGRCLRSADGAGILNI